MDHAVNRLLAPPLCVCIVNIHFCSSMLHGVLLSNLSTYL